MSETRKYDFTVEKIHENILIQSNKDRKNHLDKVIILQIYVKRRWEVRHNVRSSRNSQPLYYIGVKAEGFRLSPQLTYSFRLFNKHTEAIRDMRKRTNKAIRNKDFKFIADPSLVKIKSLEILQPSLNHKPSSNAGATISYAPRPTNVASEVFNAMTPEELIESKDSEEMIVRIL